MKTITTLLNKVFGSKKQTELTDAQLDAWIVSIRQKPQLAEGAITVYIRKPKAKNNGLEEAGNLVLA